MLVNIFIVGFCVAILIASSLFPVEWVSTIRTGTIIVAVLNMWAFLCTFLYMKVKEDKTNKPSCNGMITRCWRTWGDM